MKSYPDKLRELPLDKLKELIEKQKHDIYILQIDLDIMRSILYKHITQESSTEKQPT